MSQELSVAQAWGTPLNVFYCAHCHSAHLAPHEVTLSMCPACLQATVSSEPARMRREPPELVIPFVVDTRRAGEVLAGWVRGGWFRPADLQAETLLQRVRPAYLPLWLVDSDVVGSWKAEMGYDYQAASFQERYQGGRWVSNEVTETRTRWEPRVGQIERHYDNIAVPAMAEHEGWMSRLGGFDFRSRRPYSARAISGSAVRVPDLPPESAWPKAQSALERTAEAECQIASEADHIRNWSMQARFEDLHWTQMLVPAYVTWYQEDETTCPVWINGQSGHVYGVERLSQRKANMASLIVGAVAALLFMLGGLMALVGAALVAPMAIGVVLIVGSLLLGLLAPVPAIWVWFKNSRQRQKDM
jgi:hypothetical protein